MSLNNPVTLSGRIEREWQLVYRIPTEELKGMLPPNLHLLRHGGFAFYNVSIAKVRDLRPTWSPWGLSSWMVGYRLYASLRPLHVEPVPGLFFVHTDCSSFILSVVGNALSDLHFHHSRIEERDDGVDAYSRMTPCQFRAHRGTPELTEGSPFATLDEALEALQPPPNHLAVTGWLEGNVVRTQRAEFRTHPCVVDRAEFSALRGHHAALELCFEVDPMDCVWPRGQRVWLLG